MRRNDGKKINYKGKHSNKVADNLFVVPYNPYLLLKFNSHLTYKYVQLYNVLNICLNIVTNVKIVHLLK